MNNISFLSIFISLVQHLHDLCLLLLRGRCTNAALKRLLDKPHDLILIHLVGLLLPHHLRHLPLLVWTHHVVLAPEVSVSVRLHSMQVLLALHLTLLHHHEVLLLVEELLLGELRVLHLVWVHHDHLLEIHWGHHHLLLVGHLLVYVHRVAIEVRRHKHAL